MTTKEDLNLIDPLSAEDTIKRKMDESVQLDFLIKALKTERGQLAVGIGEASQSGDLSSPHTKATSSYNFRNVTIDEVVKRIEELGIKIDPEQIQIKKIKIEPKIDLPKLVEYLTSKIGNLEEPEKSVSINAPRTNAFKKDYLPEATKRAQERAHTLLSTPIHGVNTEEDFKVESQSGLSPIN